MSRAVVEVDAVVLAWIVRADARVALLKEIERHFLALSGRLGYVRTGASLSEYTGGRGDLEHLLLTDDGLLTAVIQVREDPPALNWDRGTLSIWRGQEIVPETLRPSLAGRRLGDVVTHPLLPVDAIVTGCDDDGLWMRLPCSGYTVPVERARAMVTEGRTR